MTWDEALKEVLNVNFTFSINCISGYVDDCGCWRCLRERDEVSTEETEKQAEIRAILIKQKERL